ncbi:adenine phosphoribosyltransferase [Stenotrophomonas sp. RIT309]|uniref:phosphoribosyltransferase family protein n=1 Tax=Stenotrophomonas sp. RIT309 TaxID=1470590 RepID=UPI00044A7114|nr:phosphoribosyltransferase family protein [Stenotrophomonas sp. RIT309]EZP42940.1 adenine phosphoribosyltransferase [Stenotrophomonas sp. RIT309]
MALKLLLVSVTGTVVNPLHKVDHQIAKQLGALAAELHAHGVKVALWSNEKWTCNGLPLAKYVEQFAGVPIYAHGMGWDGSPARHKGDSAAGILKTHAAKRSETLFLGGGEGDMIAGVNNRLLHIRSDWYGQTSDHGFQVQSVEELRRFCLLFGLRKHNLFWRVQHGSLDVATAGPFSTIKEAYAHFGYDAREAAKFGAGHPDFWFYITIASLYFSGLMEDVDYICSFPGHKAGQKNPSADSMEAILARMGRCTRSSYYHDLIVRHADALKSQPIKSDDRLFSTQINSIKLNKNPHRNLADEARKSAISLKGKRVLVVDDMVTSGRSLECARAFIEAAGGTAVLFGWLKTINTAYREISPTLSGLKAFAPNAIAAEPKSIGHSYHDSIIGPDAPAELDGIFKRFCSWPS